MTGEGGVGTVLSHRSPLEGNSWTLKFVCCL